MKQIFTALSALLLCFTIQSSHSLTQDNKTTKDKPTMVKLHTNKGVITLQQRLLRQHDFSPRDS
jgi:acid phosphatase class B